MPTFYWQNIGLGKFRYMRSYATSRWESIRFFWCKLAGRAVWRAYPFGTMDESHRIAELDMSDRLLEGLAEVQQTIVEFALRLCCCLDYPTIHPGYSAQSANFLSDDGLLGVAAFWAEWRGQGAMHFSCTSQLAGGRLLCTVSGAPEDDGGLARLPNLEATYAQCRTLEPVLRLHRQRLAQRAPVPWTEHGVRHVVIDLWNEGLAHNERTGALYAMTPVDLEHVQHALDACAGS